MSDKNQTTLETNDEDEFNSVNMRKNSDEYAASIYEEFMNTLKIECLHASCKGLYMACVTKPRCVKYENVKRDLEKLDFKTYVSYCDSEEKIVVWWN